MPDRPLPKATFLPMSQISAQLDEHRRAAHATEALLPQIERVAALLCERFATGGTLYTFGNGGSAADAQHLTGEMIGHYRAERRPLPAVTLSTDGSVLTGIANDYAFADVFARQVAALAGPGDVVAGFSTSGRSGNVVAGLAAARGNGAATVLFCGQSPGEAVEHADHVLAVPSTSTPRIQEMHTTMLHLISDAVDAWAVAGGGAR